jgi:tripartite-type tricarboxylate transporter receptor subunit TctC
MRRALPITLLATMLCILSAVPALAFAQDSYPSRQVRLIVPTNAGGAPDTLARILAQKLGAHFNRPFVVENKPGAANLIGSDYVAKSPPDGYTLLIGTSQVFGILPGMHPKMPFDAVKDFTPIMRMVDTPHLIVVPSSLPVNNIPEFVKYVAARPGQLSYGSSGIGSSHHLIMEALMARAGGLSMVHVPFKGSQDNLQSLLGGNLQVSVIVVSSSIQQIRAGRIKPLGISTIRRSSLAPDIVPIAEQGYPGFDLTNTAGLFAPGGTPRPVVLSLEAATAKAINDPETMQSLEKIGFELAILGSEDYAKAIRADVDAYGSVIKAANVKME